jgi:hypothetical protein
MAGNFGRIPPTNGNEHGNPWFTLFSRPHCAAVSVPFPWNIILVIIEFVHYDSMIIILIFIITWIAVVIIVGL